MALISQAWDSIIEPHEGLYSNDSSDRGGETVYGIARNIDKDWQGWSIVDGRRQKEDFPGNLKESATLKLLAIEYYKQNYWDKMMLDEVSDQRIATELFDIGVNMGTGAAANMMQRVLNVLNRNGKDYADLDIDGVIGHNTVEAINNHKNPVHVLLCLNAMQGTRYIKICEANPSQEKFMNGWIERVSFCY